jgi:BASS family bile acid:Na+ symporter
MARESALQLFKILVSVVIPLAAFFTGLRASGTEWRWLTERRGLLGRSLLAVLVLVPVGAMLLAEALRLSPTLKAGLAVAIVAVGIGPPAAFKRTQAAQDLVPYEIDLNVLLLLSSVVFMPLVVALHGRLYQHQVRLAPGAVASVVLTRSLIPLALGMMMARLAPRVVGPVVRHGTRVVTAAVVAVVLFAIALVWRALLGVGAAGWLAILAVSAFAVLVGHLMGGPQRGTRGVLAAFSAIRFPALALLLISMVPQGRRLLPVVLAYVIGSTLMVAVYGALMAAGERRRPGRVAAVVNPYSPDGTDAARGATSPASSIGR